MSKVVDHLAALTGFRDRDVLDTTLAGALRDLLRPRLVAIYRRVGEEGDERWLTRASLAAGDVAAAADPVWAELSDLPRLDQFPARVASMQRLQPVAVPGHPHVTAFPLVSDREPVGALEVHSDAPLGSEALRLVDSILRIYRNVQGLLDYSERDMLTGLLNRKTFDEVFYKTAAVSPAAADAGKDARRSTADAQRPYLGLIDIDHFKVVNDTYGHLIGDEVLLLLSRLMRSTFRFQDQLYRFGGEEFVVLMRCASDADAGAAFERLRRNTAAYVFPQVGHITLSVGYTEVGPGDDPNSAFQRADDAIYWAKSHGRDQVCSHSRLVEQGELHDDRKSGGVELF